MVTKKLAEKVKEIEMPEEMQARILRNCNLEMNEKRMGRDIMDKTINKEEERNNVKTGIKMKTGFSRKLVVTVASLTLCVCVAGITTLAATGKLEGYFKDIKRWDGAVVGTSYEQATDEVEVKVIDVADTLTLEVIMVNPNVAPYRELEQLGIGSYHIVDGKGKVVEESKTAGKAVESAEVVDGRAIVNVPLENILNGEYQLIISELVGSKKADQPLGMHGTWECEFTK